MRKLLQFALVAALGLTLAACSGDGASSQPGDAPQGSQPRSASAEPADDAIKIEEIDWAVAENVIGGDRRVALSYTNNSSFTIMGLRIEFTQREGVTAEDRAVFDEAYADPDTAPIVDASELYASGTNEHFVEPGEAAGPATCSLAYAVTSLTMDQFNLMEPSIAEIRYLGGDGKTYLEYYDFLNETYSLDESATEDLLTAWPDSELAQMVPTTEAPAIIVDEDDEESFMFHAYGVSRDAFAPYVEQCQDAGFSTVDYDGDTWYVATDDNGYEINVSYYESNDSLCVEVSAPDA